MTEKQATLVTKEGLKKLQDELETIKNVQMVKIAAKLKEAVAQGDLSENAEYAEAKEEQQMAIVRANELELQVRNAEVIKKGGGAGVTIGSKVKVKNLTRGKETEEYVIVGSVEANPLESKISNSSPLGSALLGKKKGDKITINVPAGEMVYEIVKID